MSTENKSFMKLVISIILFFLLVMLMVKSKESLYNVFQFVFILILIGIIIAGISLILIIRKIKKYFDFQQQIEYDFNQFFNDFYNAEFEFKRYQEFKKAQDEFREKKKYYNNDYNRYTYNNYDRNINNNEVTKALILFGYKDISLVTESDLKKKYRFLIKKAHPDNGGSEEKTQTINECYKVLLNIIK